MARLDDVARARAEWEALGVVPAAMRFIRRVSGPGQFEWMDDEDNIVATEEYERSGLFRGKNRAVLDVPSTSYELRRPSGPETSSWRYLMKVTDLESGEEVITPSYPLGSLGLSNTMVIPGNRGLRVRRTRRRHSDDRQYSFVTITNGARKQVLHVRYIPASPADTYFVEARLQALVHEGCPARPLLPLVALAGDILTYGVKAVRWPPE